MRRATEFRRVLCGDFNVADELDVWNTAVWEGKIHFSKPERAALTHVKQWGFVDVFRKINPDAKEFSWWDYREGSWQRNRGLRIDHIWTSPSLAEKCTGCWIDKAPRALEKPSDHTRDCGVLRVAAVVRPVRGLNGIRIDAHKEAV